MESDSPPPPVARSFMTEVFREIGFFLWRSLCCFARRHREAATPTIHVFSSSTALLSPENPSSSHRNDDYFDASSLPTPTSLARSRNVSFSSTSQVALMESDHDTQYPLSHRLRCDLEDACVIAEGTGPPESFKFVPHPELTRLVNLDTVLAIITEQVMAEGGEAFALANRIIQESPRLFAILLTMGREGDICSFLDEGFQDADLPVHRQFSDGTATNTFVTRHDQTVVFPPDWDARCRSKLGSKQGRMLVEVFRLGGYHDLDRVPPPFIQWEEMDAAEGGFSEVITARIHPDHHDFGDHGQDGSKGRLVAVKRLFKGEASAFEAEQRIHQLLITTTLHTHIVKLLCSYKQSGKYHMIFERAKGTLRDFWRDTPGPVLEHGLMLWSVKQMAGIASALDRIHNPDHPGLFVRHGDLKAENILFFDNYPGYDDPRGLLQIADFGLACFHSQNSRSTDDPRRVRCNSTYAPPESDARRMILISRAWDIWSQGCMYLEWATALLHGFQGLYDFSERRGSDDNNPEFNTDHFFAPDDFSVRPSVHRWVEDLHRHPKCTNMIHDLLMLIMSSMIVPDPAERYTSGKVLTRLEEIYARSRSDPGYLLNPAPYSPRRRPALIPHAPALVRWPRSGLTVRRRINPQLRSGTWPLLQEATPSPL